MIEISGIEVRATRITYVGELGWEIYVPVSDALILWESLIAAGEEFGLMPCGYKAIESLRLEKGYRAWAGEINTETNPWEAGLAFAVSLKKDKFHGRDALVLAKEKITRRLVAITFENICDVPLGNEAIRIGEKIIGRIKSGGQGYTLGKAIAYAYLENSFTTAGTSLDVELFGRWVRGTICDEPLFDPKNERVKS